MTSHDLASLLTATPSPAVRYGQGTIVRFDPGTFENVVSWRGQQLVNLPVVGGVDAFGFLPGDSVALLGWDAGGRHGVTQWWILGRLIVPGGTETAVDPPALIAAKEINVGTLNADEINVDGKDLATFISESITAQVPDSDPDPPPMGTTKFVKVYNAEWSQAYQGDNSKNTFNAKPKQGYYSGVNGNQRSLIGFPSSQIISDVGSGTITKVRVYLYFDHWYYNSGGTAVIGHHDHASEPSTFSATTNVVRVANWPKPGGKWVTYSDDLSEWKTGDKKGIAIGPGLATGDAGRIYYGSIHGANESKRPRLEVTYHA